jgi:hypothetical protein
MNMMTTATTKLRYVRLAPITLLKASKYITYVLRLDCLRVNERMHIREMVIHDENIKYTIQV